MTEVTQMPPSDPELEESVLGCLLVDFEAVPICMAKLSADCFYHNEDIYSAIESDYESNGEVDMMRVEHALKSEVSDESEVRGKIASITRNPALGEKAEEYCDILQDLAARRNGQSGMRDILGDIHQIDSMEMITRMEDIVQGNIGAQKIPGMTYSEIMAREDTQDTAEQLYTGDRFFDETFFGEEGSRRGGVLVPFGQSGHGKTEFSVWLTARYLDQGYRGVFCIRESKDSKVAKRIYRNMENPDNIENLIIADTRQGLSNLSDMASTVKYHNAVRPIDFFVWDHLRIIPVEGLNEWQENKRITACVNRGMYLSQEVDAFGILPSQVNRATLNNARGWGKDPNLNNLYGSSAIEQAASMAVSIFRPREVDELVDHYQNGTPRAVKGANYQNNGETFDLNSVFIQQKKIRDGERYMPFVRFIHTDNGFKRSIEKKPF